MGRKKYNEKNTIWICVGFDDIVYKCDGSRESSCSHYF